MTAMIDAFRCAWAQARSDVISKCAAARPWLEPLGVVLKVRRGPALAGLAVLSLGVWWHLPSDERAAEGRELRAELAETREALRTAQQTLRVRARAIEMAESEIEALTQELREVRAAAGPAPDAPVLAADEHWLMKRAR